MLSIIKDESKLIESESLNYISKDSLISKESDDKSKYF